MFKEVYQYKNNFEELINRYNKLHRDLNEKKTGNLFFRVFLKSDGDVYTKLDIGGYDYNKYEEIRRYAHDLCSLTEKALSVRSSVGDDAIPIILPFLGIGDFSAFVTGDIHFAKETSWSRPSLKRIRDYKNIEPLGSAHWYKKMISICTEIMQISKGSGIPFSKAFFSPLDLAESLRGIELYTDFYEDPEGVHDLLGYCTDALIFFMEDIYALIRHHLGDKTANLYFYDSIINNMSEDIACLISPEHYREFAAPYTQRVINHFGKSNMHCHSKALYLVKEICKLDHVMTLWLASDPNEPRAIDNLGQMIEDANGVCLAIDCSSIEEIEKNIETARKGNVCFFMFAESPEEANEATKRFRKLTE